MGEVLIEKRYYAGPVDLWACGVILMEMLCGIDAFVRFLQWPRKARPHQSRGLEIMDALKDPQPLKSYLEEIIGPVGNPNFPDYMSRTLFGTMDPLACSRWPCSNVEDEFKSKEN